MVQQLAAVAIPQANAILAGASDDCAATERHGAHRPLMPCQLLRHLAAGDVVQAHLPVRMAGSEMLSIAAESQRGTRPGFFLEETDLFVSLDVPEADAIGARRREQAAV